MLAPTWTAAELRAGPVESARNVADLAACDRVMGQLVAVFGKLDALVNCTGLTGRTNVTREEGRSGGP